MVSKSRSDTLKMAWQLPICLLLAMSYEVATQHSSNYDTSDWIPMSPSVDSVAKRATGRVLNVDSPPVQNYFAPSTVDSAKYSRKRPGSAYILEPPAIPLRTFFDHPFKFDIPATSPIHHHSTFFLQTPPSQELTVPPLRHTNLYRPATTVNHTNYRPLNPNTVNREILTAINLNVPPPGDETTKDTVQLLYVPLENFQQKQPEPTQNLYILPSTTTTTTTTTTPSPTPKRKPHQPPLAVYMESPRKADVGKVLTMLKNARTISVLDRVGPNTPQIFVGPSNLTPSGYTKFPLPYLSSLAGRFERKVDQLPFFVAPLSYKTPDGYSKIPLPSPHIGSVVVSTKGQQHQLQPQNTFQQFQFGPFQNYASSPHLPPRAPLTQYNPFLTFGNAGSFATPHRTSFDNHVLAPPQQTANYKFYVQKPPPLPLQQLPIKQQQSFIQTSPRPQLPSYRPTNFDYLLTSPIPPPTRQKLIKTTSYNNNFVFQPTRQQDQEVTPPLQPAINQLELQQINNEFAAAIFNRTEDYIKFPSTPRTVIPSKLVPFPTEDAEKYTVLEEFVVNPNVKSPISTTTSTTTNKPPFFSNTVVETIPAKVYKITPSTTTTSTTAAPIEYNPVPAAEILGILDEEILRQRPPVYSVPHNVQYVTYPQEPHAIPDLVNGLQDHLQEQQVRSLLTSHMLLPTSATDSRVHSTAGVKLIPIEPTAITTIQTTSKPTEIPHTVRYSTTSSTTRRTVNRRRPTIGSTTTAQEPPRYSAKSKFRSRGRPANIDISSVPDSSETVEPTADVNIELSRENAHIYPEPSVGTTVSDKENHIYSVYPNDVTKITPKPIITHSSTDGVRDPVTTPRPSIVTRPHFRRTTTAVSDDTSRHKVSSTRVRGKSRYGHVSKSTPATTTTTTVVKSTTAASPVYSSTYSTPLKSTLHHLLLSEEGVTTTQPTVRFLGEVRPRYVTTTQPSYVTETEETPTRIRFRTRPPPTATVATSTSTPRFAALIHRGRPHPKDDHSGDNVGHTDNYPIQFLRQQFANTAKSNLMVSDQLPYSSIYRSNILADSPSESPASNQLDSESDVTVPVTTADITTTTSSAPIQKSKIKKNGRRRGVWKLVRQRPIVDQIDVAESQNYDSILNNFHDAQDTLKVGVTTTTTTTPTTSPEPEVDLNGGGFFDSLYQMFDNTETTTNSPPSYPEEFIDETTVINSGTFGAVIASNDSNTSFPDATTSTVQTLISTTTLPPPSPSTAQTTPPNSFGNYAADESEATYEASTNHGDFLKDMESLWEMSTIKTSTATEVTHETEICYKGKCVKSQEPHF